MSHPWILIAILAGPTDPIRDTTWRELARYETQAECDEAREWYRRQHPEWLRVYCLIPPKHEGGKK